MVESELGFIPKGWSVDLLGKVVNISYGKNLPTKNLLLKGYPVFGGNGIIGYTDKFLYKNPKVLVSCRGAASGSVLNSLKNSFVTNNSLILEDNEKISYEYLKELSKNRGYFDFVSGSAQPQVTIASISQCKIIIPQRKTLNEFTKVMKDSNEIIENLYYENLKLAQLRDELLPKLMNGEIEVPIEE
jgi:type I restriction enzyme S subunit